MSYSASFELQRALVAHLNGQAALAALIGDPPRIFDQVPQASQRPYLFVRRWRVDDQGTDDQVIVLHRFELVVASAYQGHKESKAIASAVAAALEDAALALEGFKLAYLLVRSIEFEIDPAAELSAGVIAIEALTHSNP